MPRRASTAPPNGDGRGPSAARARSTSPGWCQWACCRVRGTTLERWCSSLPMMRRWSPASTCGSMPARSRSTGPGSPTRDRVARSFRVILDRMTTYDFRSIEARWQAHWAEQRTFRAVNPGDPGFDQARPRYYVLDMFPYPSGVGLHVGHPLGYIATDIVARYKRMRGFNVLHPMGFDAFGLPAEQFAVEHGVHPRITTEANIANMVRQLKRLGLSYDWDRCLATTDIGYYRWTQWIFLQLHNSYFDPIAQKARPIDELIQQLGSGELVVGPGDDLLSVAGSGAMN